MIVHVTELALPLTEKRLREALKSQQTISVHFNDDARANGNATITSIRPADHSGGLRWTAQFTIPGQPNICFEFDFGVPPRRP